MKKFIGTKVIMAEPMTMTEAQKVLGREIKPATVEEDGYLVEYQDGYKSWSPKSVFDESYKSAETFLDRMKLEFGMKLINLKRVIPLFALRSLTSFLLLQEFFFMRRTRLRKCTVACWRTELTPQRIITHC